VHLRLPAIDPGIKAFLWALFLSLYVWAFMLAVGVDNRKLIPVAAIAGAALCVAADLLARTLLAPNELPVGVVTAFIGVPVFIALMRRRATA